MIAIAILLLLHITRSHAHNPPPPPPPPLPPSLSCISPVQRIAGSNVEFLARLTFPSFDSKRYYFDRFDLCGSFNGNELCNLRNVSEIHVHNDTVTNARITPSVDITWSLAGFLPSHHHTYVLWMTMIDSDRSTTIPLVTCDGNFETVDFPGWDNYVQSFYNTTHTVEQLKDQPETIARVSDPTFPINSFERLPDLIGPQLVRDIKPPSTLIVTFAGKSSVKEINGLAKQFVADPNISFILFAYDRFNWAQFDWVEKAIVVRVTKQMKWRFVKIFLHPSNVAAYKHVIIMDEDCSIARLDVASFLSDMTKDNVMIGQPSNGEGSYGSHEVVRQQPGRGTVLTNFAECGPFIAFDTKVWPCVFDLLQSDITCGYGYDLMWSHCGRTAVLHQHEMVHENRKPASNRPNFVMRCAAEGLTLFQRLAHSGLAPFDPAEIVSSL